MASYVRASCATVLGGEGSPRVGLGQPASSPRLPGRRRAKPEDTGVRARKKGREFALPTRRRLGRPACLPAYLLAALACACLPCPCTPSPALPSEIPNYPGDAYFCSLLSLNPPAGRLGLHGKREADAPPLLPPRRSAGVAPAGALHSSAAQRTYARTQRNARTQARRAHARVCVQGKKKKKKKRRTGRSCFDYQCLA